MAETNVVPFAQPWDNAPVVEQPQAAQPAPQANPWDEAPFVGADPHPNAVAGVVGDATSAAKAVDLGQKLNLPAPVVEADIPGFQQQHDASEAAKYAAENPHINKFVANNPTGAKIANGDYPQLDKVSQWLSAYGVGSYGDVVTKLGQLEEAKRGLVKEAVANPWQTLSNLPFFGAEYAGLSLGQLAGEVAKAVYAGMPDQLDKADPRVHEQAALGVNAALFVLGDLRFGRAPAGISTPKEVEDFLGTAEGIKTRQKIDSVIKWQDHIDNVQKLLEGPKPEGPVAGTGVSPVIDELKIKQTDYGASTLEGAIEASEASNTKKVSTPTFENFAAQGSEGSVVSIPADKIADIYGASAPREGDGKFGYVPDIAGQVARGLETGGNVDIPIDRYLANYDPAIHGLVKADIVHSEAGISQTEAKELKENPPEYSLTLQPSGPIVGNLRTFDILDATGEQKATLDIRTKDAGRTIHVDDLSARPKGKEPSAIEAKSIPSAKDYTEFAAQAPAMESTKITPDDPRIVNIDTNIKSLASELTKQYPQLGGELKSLDESIRGANDNGDVEGILDRLDAKLTFVEKNGGTTDATKRLSKMLDDVIDLQDQPLTDYSLHQAKLTGHHKFYTDTYNELVDPNAPWRQHTSDKEMLGSLEHPFEGPLQQDPMFKYAEQQAFKDAAVVLRERIQETEATQSKTPRGVGVLGNKAVIEIARQLADMYPDAGELTYDHVSGANAEKPIGEVPTARIDLNKIRARGATTAKQVEQLNSPVGQIVEKAIESERKALFLRPLFAEPLPGQTVADFARYSRLIENQQKVTTEKAIAAVERDTQRRLTAEWRKNRDEMEGEVTSDFNYRPDLMAERYLRTGGPSGSTLPAGIKIDPKSMPEGATLPKGMIGKVGDKKLMSVDDMAGAFGFRSGKEMIDNLNELVATRKVNGETPSQYRTRIEKEEVARRMEAKYGKHDADLLENARADAIDESQLEIMEVELNALAKEAGEEPPHWKKKLEAMIEKNFGGAISKTAAKPEAYLNNVAKAGVLAERALLKKDYVEAFNQKQRQMRSMVMARQAKAFKKELKALQKTLDKFAKRNVFPGIAQDFTNQIHGLMERIGEPTKREAGSLPNGEDLENFIAGQDGEGLLIPRPNLPNKNSLAEFTVNEVRDTKATIDALEKKGRDAQKIIKAGKAEAYEAVIDEAMGNLNDLSRGDFDPTATGIKVPVGKVMRFMDSGLIKMERLFDWIDHYDSNGAMNRTVFRPLSEAQGLKNDIMSAVGEGLNELRGDRTWRRSLKEKVKTDLLDPAGRPMKLTRANLLAMALNTGTESNFKVLAEGRNWSRDSIVDALNEHLTAKDWAFVNGMWRMLEKHLAKRMQDVTEELSGIPVSLVKGFDVTTPHGTFKGGYYPLIADPYYAVNNTRANTDLFDNTRFNPLPSPRATKRRTGTVYPVDLNLSSLPPRLAETIHNVAYRIPVINARKVLANRQIRMGISNAFGPEYTALLDPWLKHIAQDGGSFDLSGNKFMQGVYQTSAFFRTNVVGALLGVNPGTVAIHGGAVASNSIFEAGAGPFLRAATDLMFRNVDTTTSFMDKAIAESSAVRNRTHDLDSDLGFSLDKALGQKGIARARVVQIQFMTALIRMVDFASAVPTYHAGKMQAIAAGMNEEDAIYAGEKLMRNAHGSNGLVDTAAIQRIGEFPKWGTMFYSLFSHNYNQTRNLVRVAEGKGPEDIKGGDKFWYVLGGTIAMIAVPGILHGLTRHPPSAVKAALFSDEDQDEDENLWLWGAKSMAGQFAGMVPGIRDLYQTVYGYEASPTPMADIYKTFTQLKKDLGKHLDTEEAAPKEIQDAIDLFAYTTGFGNKTIGKAGQFVWDTANGRQEPDSLTEWMRGLSTGKAQPSRRH